MGESHDTGLDERRGPRGRAVLLVLAVETLEAAVAARAWLRGLWRHADPWKHFDDGGVEGAERACLQIHDDIAGYMRPPAEVEPANVAVVELARRGGVITERIAFDSPRPSGVPRNDRVEARLWRTVGSAAAGRVLVFHHPVFQAAWLPYRWFLTELIEAVPVAQLAAPWHYGRTPPGWFPGEGTINPNPLRLYEAIRQWFADQRALHRLLETRFGLKPVGVVGQSLGAFQSLMATSFGELDLPVVAVSSTNRYAYGLTNGGLARHVVRAMRRVGIDEQRLARMVDSMQLERYVPALHDHPVLFITGARDRVDPPPSIERLERALRPTRSVHLAAGHATMLAFRSRIVGETLAFFRGLGTLP